MVFHAASILDATSGNSVSSSSSCHPQTTNNQKNLAALRSVAETALEYLVVHPFFLFDGDSEDGSSAATSDSGRSSVKSIGGAYDGLTAAGIASSLLL